MPHIIPEQLMTATLRQAPWGASAARMLAAALAAVEPGAAVERAMQRDGARLLVGGQTYDLDAYERVFLVGAGKANAPMAVAAAALLADRLTGGVVVVKDDGTPLPDITGVRLLQASHPVPDERSQQSTQQIAALLAQATDRDLVLALLSGGGSALLTLPAPGIALADMQALTQALLACGATINELNCVRKHLDQVKGGGLARLASPATLVTLILSDVVGNPLDVIASGPTVPDPTTYADALAILTRYGLRAHVPGVILTHLEAGQQGQHADTPGPGDPLFARVQNEIIASNRQAAVAAVAAAQAEGWHARVLTTAAQGEARVLGALLAEMAAEIAAAPGDVPPLLPLPACLVVGGETTVTLRGDGRGGRNQELALAAVRPLAGSANAALITLATDGGDGPTDAAGAVVTGGTWEAARQHGLSPDAALATNDSYAFFAALNDLLRPGATATNVNDLTLLLVWEPQAG